MKVTGRGENPHLNIPYYGPEWPIRIVKLLHHFVLGYIADSKTLHQDKLTARSHCGRQAAPTTPPPPTRINLWIAARKQLSGSRLIMRSPGPVLPARRPPPYKTTTRAPPVGHRRAPCMQPVHTDTCFVAPRPSPPSRLSVCRDRSYSAPPFTRSWDFPRSLRSDCLRWCN